MAIDMIELCGGFPSREMLKSRDWVKSGDCDLCTPIPTLGGLSGVLGSEGRSGRRWDKTRKKEPPSPPVPLAPGDVTTERVSQNLDSQGRLVTSRLCLPGHRKAV